MLKSRKGAVVGMAAWLAPAGVCAVVYLRLADLPHFNPDNDRDPLPEPVEEMNCSGAQTPSCCRLLNMRARSRAVSRTYVDGRSEKTAFVFPSGSINPWAHKRFAGHLSVLSIVLDWAGADVIGAACKDIPVPRDAVDDDGGISLPEIRAGASRVMIEHT